MAERNFIISTETTCDMPEEYIATNNINIMGLTFNLEDKNYETVGDNLLDIKEFYAKVRGGAMPKTAQVPIEVALQSFEAWLEKGYDIIHLSFSSALSGTYQSCSIAATDLREKYPDRKIYVIDSLSASMGQGLLLNYMVELKKDGKSIDEIYELTEKNKLKFCHYFTVDDLNHLHRGGRVSKMAAVFGGVLGIKPILHVDNLGRLIPIAKVRGRKQSLAALADKMAEKIGNNENKVVYISHGDCLDDAKYLGNIITERFGIKNIVYWYVGPVIGSHSGPGTVALFFVGDNRDED